MQTPFIQSHRFQGFQALDAKTWKQGSALMLVMAAIIIMSVSVLGVAKFMDYSLREKGRESLNFRAMHLAESGIAIGLHPNIQAGDPALKQKVGEDSGFEVLIRSEGAFIPINSITDELIANGCYELFIDWGLSPNQAQMVVDCLADWIDTDDDPRSQGAESSYYQGLDYANFPRQQSFNSLEEMLLVRGMNLVEAIQPNWRNYFSVHNTGSIDINHAAPEILAAFLDIDISRAQNLARENAGPDGILNTDDDVSLDITQAQQLLGLSSEDFNNTSSILTTQSTTRRISSTGRIGEHRYTIIVIASQQSDGSLNFLARYEE